MNNVIFDVVLNIENLCSIDSISNEIRSTVSNYRALGKEGLIVNDKFNIVDEVKGSVELFNNLNTVLSSAWDLMYAEAEQYYIENGNLEVSKRYKTKTGLNLGNWLTVQRRVYNGRSYGILTQERISKLDSIGMRWESAQVVRWRNYYIAAKAYYEEFGNLLVPATLIYHDIKLGAWISRVRRYRKYGMQYITPEQISELDKIGMIWSVIDLNWEKNITAAREYFNEHGNLDVSCNYVTSTGLQLGAWIFSVRESYLNPNSKRKTLTKEQIQELSDIGMKWKKKGDFTWEAYYDQLCEYKKEHGNIEVPSLFICENGCKLGKWLYCQKVKYGVSLLKERAEKLEALGVDWNFKNPWFEKFEIIKSYYDKHGNVDVSTTLVIDGVWIGKWLDEQVKRLYGQRGLKVLTDKQVELLKSIGAHKKLNGNDKKWKDNYDDLVKYYKENGNTEVPHSYVSKNGRYIGKWAAKQRLYYANHRLAEDRIKMLQKIHFRFEIEEPWDTGYKHAEAYYEQNGNLSVAKSYVCFDGYRLGNWIAGQRHQYSVYQSGQEASITKEQIDKLNQISMIWNVFEYNWRKAFTALLEYIQINDTVRISKRYITQEGINLNSWLNEQRKAQKLRKIKPNHERLLIECGVLDAVRE